MIGPARLAAELVPSVMLAPAVVKRLRSIGTRTLPTSCGTATLVVSQPIIPVTVVVAKRLIQADGSSSRPWLPM